ncbi:predicted protein [Histoplasma mississippiense (nom. inval.)]|uniref:predicted protein n=1 Tax=Ajellomyces capsulatus (strain NAm1 / WU24) TaxID=2059318 RepID=UPI000157B441|nr:predicted protein [Histoplasma mississippiense (nom. inval.)]EDN02538.1 predicted protein [Histoplasma mississippiense (nom. inval.)]
MITAADVLFMGFAFLLLLRNSISNNLTFSTTSRFFSSTDRSLLQIMWKGTQRVTKYDEMIGKSVENNSELKDRVATVEIAGQSTSQRCFATVSLCPTTGCWRLSNTVPDVNFAGNNLDIKLSRNSVGVLVQLCGWHKIYIIKVSANNYADKKSAETELHITEHITRANPQHVGHDFTKGIGRPVITDFGLAVRGDVPHLYYHTIQADDYRAPEIILTAGWSYSADIWNLGVLLWDLLEKDGGFGALSPGNMEYTSERHLAHMIALLGPPPKKLLDQGHETTKYFDHDGAFRYPELIPENVSLVDSLNQIKDEDKISFLAFIMRMLRWQPEERSSAKDLLADPWLRANH